MLVMHAEFDSVALIAKFYMKQEKICKVATVPVKWTKGK